MNEELWDSRAETYDWRYRFLRWTQKKLVSQLSFGENPCLLDLACGTGWAVRYSARLIGGKGTFYGVDNSSKMIEQAKTKSKSYANVFFEKSMVEKLSFSDNFFDFVISSNAFHHFSDSEKALKETFRVLKVKGKVCILDATADNFFTQMIDGLSRRLEAAHIKTYSTKEFKELFEKAKLHYVESKWIYPAVKIHIAEKS